MPLLSKFDTPASLRDMPVGSPFYDRWHQIVNDLVGPTPPSGSSSFWYNPTTTDVNVAGEKRLTWTGFPRTLMVYRHRDDKMAAFRAAETGSGWERRGEQDEYFEWRVDRNAAGRITRVTFVSETPEYYKALWDTDPSKVLELYRTHVNPSVTLADLRDSAGNYDQFNRWNTSDGIMHYIMSINTLTDAIGLARGSATPAGADNYDINGGAPTSVDPRVVIDLHMIARKGLYLTLRNPIGLYIAGWNDSGFQKPDGTVAGNYWRVTRGTPGMAMRVIYEVPAGLGFVVGDMKIGGRPIEFGGQIAEHMTVEIAGIAGTLAGMAATAKIRNGALAGFRRTI